MRGIFYFLVFPGFLFAAAAGLALLWIDGWITAKFQGRSPQAWYQPGSGILPGGISSFVSLSAPLASLAGVMLAWNILWRSVSAAGSGLEGDLIALLYLLNILAVGVLMGGLTLQDPSASFGVRRHLRLMTACELPFILSVFVPVVVSGGLVKLSELVAYQRTDVFFRHPSIVLAFLTAIACSQAKLAMPPFDAPFAETEIAAGAYTGYSGFGLAIYRFSRAVGHFSLAFFLAVVFCGGIKFDGLLNVALGIFKVGGIIIASIFIKNVIPRIKMDQAVKFFSGPMTAAAITAALLAILGF